jgi:hypothetical protein
MNRKPSFWNFRVGCFGWSIIGFLLIDTIGVGIGQLLPAVQAAREAARRAQCRDNLRRVASAMMNYRQQYGCFPPAFVADKNGKPMHSWRALLLPYLEGTPVPYNYDQPWDSPGNRGFTEKAYKDYQCPSRFGGKRSATSYMMVVGPHGISDGLHSRKTADVTDDPAKTIMLVEVADSDVGWAEPRDLRFDQIDVAINSEKRKGIGSSHHSGALVAFCDGQVEFIENTISPERVKAMLTIDGGEKIRDEESY